MSEAADRVTFQGNPLTLVGEPVGVGQTVPDFVALANDLSEVHLAELRGKICVLMTVPSLDTSVCDLQVRRFNTEAASLGDDVVVLAISMDLPFAQARWCGAADVANVRTLSDHRDAAAGRALGVLIDELRLLARSVFVVDREGTVAYKQIVGELTDEPDYDEALAAVARLAT